MTIEDRPTKGGDIRFPIADFQLARSTKARNRERGTATAHSTPSTQRPQRRQEPFHTGPIRKDPRRRGENGPGSLSESFQNKFLRVLSALCVGTFAAGRPVKLGKAGKAGKSAPDVGNLAHPASCNSCNSWTNAVKPFLNNVLWTPRPPQNVPKRCESLRNVAKRCVSLRTVAFRCKALRSVAGRCRGGRWDCVWSRAVAAASAGATKGQEAVLPHPAGAI